MEDLKNLHHWDVLALSCIDGRFIKKITEWLGREAGDVFDYRCEVGCSKAIIDSPEDRERFFQVIETSKRLHSIKEVWLIDHVDCGAYGGSKEQTGEGEEADFHKEKLREAAKIVSDKFSDLLIRKFYASWEKIEEV